MKGIHFILGFLTLLLVECKYKQKTYGKIRISFEDPGEITFPKQIINKEDSCVLRFMWGFKNDSILIEYGKEKDLIIANTNESIAFACDHMCKKEGFEYYIITISGQEYLIPIKKNYYAIDIYKRAKDSIDVDYSNNILILSKQFKSDPNLPQTAWLRIKIIKTIQ